MKFTVWIDYGSEGWQPSEELHSLRECLDHVVKNSYGRNYRITREVEVEFVEKAEALYEPHLRHEDRPVKTEA